jgi:hypothetical protein
VVATTIAGQAGVRYATNSSVVFVWQTPDKTWAELSIAAALASRADEIVASLVPAPRPTDSSTSTSSTVPETTTPTTANGTVDTIPMPADWMFQLIAPDNGFAVPVTFGSALSAGWIISDLEWNPLTADESHPALVEADANANAAVGVPTWGLGTRLDWHDRVNGNASFVVTGVMTSNGSKLIGTNEGHVLVIDVKGPGDEQWTAFATRLPQVIGRFAMTKAIRTPNEDVWRIPTPDAPMYLAAGTIDGPLSPTENIAIVSERTDVGEALTFAQIGSTASWQTLHDGTQNLIAVGKVITGELKPLPIGTVLIVQGRLADGGYVQVYFALAT